MKLPILDYYSQHCSFVPTASLKPEVQHLKNTRRSPSSDCVSARAHTSSHLRQPAERPVLCSATASAAQSPVQSVALPTSSETARTIVDIVSHGTLATLNEDGTPLGTFISYVLAEDGEPLIRLRHESVHKANLTREPRCSLFVHPSDRPARMLARVTLIGRAVPVAPEVAAQAAEVHARTAQHLQGVDKPQETDEFFKLEIDRCFYVGGMDNQSKAQSLTKEEYTSAEPDILRSAAPTLVKFFNHERREDVMRIAAHSSNSRVEQIYAAELLWVDRTGAYVACERYNYEHEILRVTFQRPVMDERDARSVLTMLAQFAWEEERHYNPPIPEAIA